MGEDEGERVGVLVGEAEGELVGDLVELSNSQGTWQINGLNKPQSILLHPSLRAPLSDVKLCRTTQADSSSLLGSVASLQGNTLPWEKNEVSAVPSVYLNLEALPDSDSIGSLTPIHALPMIENSDLACLSKFSALVFSSSVVMIANSPSLLLQVVSAEANDLELDTKT